MAEGSSEDLDELRRLLIGSDSERAAEAARILPEAVRGAKAKNLREAIEPVFEKAFESSVRKHPKELAEAIYPVIGPAIRKSIAAAIGEFAEALNQIVEKSVSLRALQWRVEALLTGKSFSEILLARSLLYSVAQVFLIHRTSGILLLQASAEDAVVKDADMIAGMLTAIQDFMRDSFAEAGQDLGTVEMGHFTLWVQYGPKALLVGAVSGTAPVELKGKFRNALDKIHELCYEDLDRFKQGDVSVFEPARPELEACLLGQASPAKKQSTWPVWALAGLLLVLLAGLGWYRWREQNRWEQYFDAVRRQPGLVVTGIEKRGSDYVVTGLRDPLAKAPSHEHVRFEWQPYLSLNTPFAKEREIAAAVDQLENHLVRFDVGSSRISSGVARQVDEAALEIRQVLKLRPQARIGVVGRADEVGSPLTNQKLSEDRAKNVIVSLVDQGVPPDRLELLALGNAKPLRAGDSDWARASNRSVAFQVMN